MEHPKLVEVQFQNRIGQLESFDSFARETLVSELEEARGLLFVRFRSMYLSEIVGFVDFFSCFLFSNSIVGGKLILVLGKGSDEQLVEVMPTDTLQALRSQKNNNKAPVVLRTCNEARVKGGDARASVDGVQVQFQNRLGDLERVDFFVGETLLSELEEKIGEKLVLILGKESDAREVEIKPSDVLVELQKHYTESKPVVLRRGNPLQETGASASGENVDASGAELARLAVVQVALARLLKCYVAPQQVPRLVVCGSGSALFFRFFLPFFFCCSS